MIVLDCRRRQRHHRPALLSLQSPLRRLLGKPLPSRLITHFYVAHPPVRIQSGQGFGFRSVEWDRCALDVGYTFEQGHQPSVFGRDPDQTGRKLVRAGDRSHIFNFLYIQLFSKAFLLGKIFIKSNFKSFHGPSISEMHGIWE